MNKYENLPTIEELINLGNNPKVHPNGFLQLELEDGYRMHVWLEIPIYKRNPDTPIHDHTFSFKSKIYFGNLINIEYNVYENPHGDSNMYTVRPYKFENKDNPLEKISEATYICEENKRTESKKNDTYIMQSGIFHQSINKGLTISIIKRLDDNLSIYPRIMCPLNQVPDNSFKRNSINQEILWREISNALELAKR